MFENLPESRRIFLPQISHEDYPYLFSQIDVLLAPFRSIPFNQSISDRRLMEAGIKTIPWIATPIPSYREWKVGGVFASDLQEWNDQLHKLINDRTLRESLGIAGRNRAELREVDRLTPAWLDLILSHARE